jgi:hypothetical protein
LEYFKSQTQSTLQGHTQNRPQYLRVTLILTLIALATFAAIVVQGAYTATAKQNSAQDDLQIQLNQVQRKLDELQTQNDLLKAQLANVTFELNHHILRRPTLEELQTFLQNSKPNLPPRNATDKNCVQFASALKRAAAAAGWNVSYVEVNYVVTWQGKQYGYGHALNGAYLADGGWVYIEPQTGEISQSLEHLIAELIFLPEPFQIQTIGIVW